MNRKLIGTITLVIIVAGFLIYLFQKLDWLEAPVVQKPEETATSTEEIDISGWKTCGNEEYGWEIKYPAEWFVYGEGSMAEDSPVIVRTTECIGASLYISNFTPNELIKQINKDMGLSIAVSNQKRLSTTIYTGSKSLDEYFGKNPKILEAHSIIKETNILGEKAVWLQEKNRIESTRPRLMFFHNEKLFEIRDRNLSPETIEIFLSNFKFLD